MIESIKGITFVTDEKEEKTRISNEIAVERQGNSLDTVIYEGGGILLAIPL